jgi:NTE family protein
MLAQGWLEDGRQGARRALDQLWRSIADHAVSSRFHGSWSDFAIDTASRLLSPYQLNPFGLNPLGNLLRQLIDVDQVKLKWPHPLLLAATNRRTGRPRIFKKDELSIEVMLASACLPQLYQAVEINGESYWDGGYTSNPPVIALIEQSQTADLLLIKINPVVNPATPVTANGIRHRVSEIVFGQPLLHELERLDLARRMARGPLRWFSRSRCRLARHNLVMIDGSAALAKLDPASRLQIDWQALLTLKDRGRETAAAWLAENELIEVSA